MQTSQRVGENHYSTQRICVKIYKGFSKINNKKTTNPIKTLVKFWNREFTKEVIKMANNHKERCFNITGIKEMQFKSTIRYHYTHTRTPKLKRLIMKIRSKYVEN